MVEASVRNLMDDMGLNESAARSERGRIPMRARYGTRYNTANDVRFTVRVVQDNRWDHEGRRERDFQTEATGRRGFSQALTEGRFVSLSFGHGGYARNWRNRRNGRPLNIGVTLCHATRFAAARSYSLNLVSIAGNGAGRLVFFQLIPHGHIEVDDEVQDELDENQTFFNALPTPPGGWPDFPPGSPPPPPPTGGGLAA